MEFTKNESIGSILAFLDFEKTFDSIERNFISRCLEVFVFGADFRKWVFILYTDVSSCVSNNGLHSDFFLSSRGVFHKEIPYHPIFLLLPLPFEQMITFAVFTWGL